jgi:hypothetical protein
MVGVDWLCSSTPTMSVLIMKLFIYEKANVANSSKITLPFQYHVSICSLKLDMNVVRLPRLSGTEGSVAYSILHAATSGRTLSLRTRDQHHIHASVDYLWPSPVLP